MIFGSWMAPPASSGNTATTGSGESTTGSLTASAKMAASQAANDAAKNIVQRELAKVGAWLQSVFTPGAQREQKREARAQLYLQLAIAGSLTAARSLYGGQTEQYTINEKKYYSDRWPKLQAAHPEIASQAIQAGGLPLPDTESDLPAADLTTMQNEIADYMVATGTVPGVTNANGSSSSSSSSSGSSSGTSPKPAAPTSHVAIAAIVGAVVLVLVIVFFVVRR